MSENTEYHRRSEAWKIILLALIVILGAALRFYQIGKLSFWNDEIFSIINSRGDFLRLLKNDPNMSLFYLLVHYWMRIFPNASDGLLRSLAAIISILGIPAVFYLGKALSSDRKLGNAVGLVSALLVAVNAYSIRYAQEFRSYSLTFLLATLSTLFLMKLIEESGSRYKWATLYVFVSAAAVYGHYLVGFLFIAQALSLPILLLEKDEYLGRLKKVLVCWLVAALLVVPTVTLAYNKGPSGLNWVPLPKLQTLKEFIILISGSQGRKLAALYLLLGGIGFYFGVGAFCKRPLIEKWKYTLLVSCLFVPPLVGFIFSRLLFPIFMPAYFFYVMPYLAALSASGIVGLVSQRKFTGRKRRVLAAAGVGFLICLIGFSGLGIHTYFSQYQKHDWRGAAQYLGAHCSDALRLYYVTWMEDNALYYNPGLFSQEKAWWKQLLAGQPNADQIAAALPKNYQQVCLALGHIGVEERASQAEKIRKALQQVYPYVDHSRFAKLDLFLYKRQP